MKHFRRAPLMPAATPKTRNDARLHYRRSHPAPEPPGWTAASARQTTIHWRKRNDSRHGPIHSASAPARAHLVDVYMANWGGKIHGAVAMSVADLIIIGMLHSGNKIQWRELVRTMDKFLNADTRQLIMACLWDCQICYSSPQNGTVSLQKGLFFCAMTLFLT